MLVRDMNAENKRPKKQYSSASAMPPIVFAGLKYTALTSFECSKMLVQKDAYTYMVATICPDGEGIRSPDP